MGRMRVAAWLDDAVWFDVLDDGAGTTVAVISKNTTAQAAQLIIAGTRYFTAPPFSGEAWTYPALVTLPFPATCEGSYPAAG